VIYHYQMPTWMVYIAHSLHTNQITMKRILSFQTQISVRSPDLRSTSLSIFTQLLSY